MGPRVSTQSLTAMTDAMSFLFPTCLLDSLHQRIERETCAGINLAGIKSDEMRARQTVTYSQVG
jgi:hypothetical protein